MIAATTTGTSPCGLAERSRREFAGFTANELEIVSRFLQRAIELTKEQLERIRADGSTRTGRELLL